VLGMNPRYIINLTEDERLGLEDLVARRKVSALKVQRARILLSIDEGALSEAEIAEDLGVGIATVQRVRKRAATHGIAAALERKEQEVVSHAPKLDGKAEAYLLQLACSEPPEGFARWTLTMLGDKLVELNFIDSICKTTVHNYLKKTKLNRG
jgi:transposase